jgi:hypothetical protein
MIQRLKPVLACVLLCCTMASFAQKSEAVKIVKDPKAKKYDIIIGDKLFTSFLYPDTLEKSVLFPVIASNGTTVTRGFPMNPKPGEPTDHPHHMGIWFNFENVNGLDFWNNSYDIPAARKSKYGWIKTDKILGTQNGTVGTLAYHANWTNQKNEVLLEETTHFEFSGTPGQRVITRVTQLKAVQTVLFKDAKDGMLGMRVARELQIPTKQAQKFTDDKGNVTTVSAGSTIENGNYLTSEGKTGDAAWSTRAVWNELHGKIGTDSISIAMIDHPKNTNYPTYWHSRGYGLFAINPLGQSIFTNGTQATNLELKPGQSVTFRYRIIVADGKTRLSPKQLNVAAAEFAKHP